MNNKPSIAYTVNNNLCTGCGICEDVCPTKSITIRLQEKEWKPFVNEETCISDKGCSKCMKVCPGLGIELKKEEQVLYPQGTQDKYIGKYIQLYTGFSNNESIRYHSSSGGLVTQFLIFLLEKEKINGAVVTGSGDDNLTPQSFVAKTKEEIINAKGSKYCPVSLNKVGDEICKSDGKYVIVGLPCHIQGFRKRAKIDKKFRERVIGYFAIYCSSNRTFSARDYILDKYNFDKKSVQYFSFRDEGCLGSMIVRGNEKGEDIGGSSRQLKIPFVNYYPGLRSFFKPRRCLSCIDHYGALADVSFGDIHIKPYSDDIIGTSSWIVRNGYFNKLFQQAEKEGYLSMNNLDAHTLNESQKTMLYSKKRKAKALMNLDSFFGRNVAQYDVAIDEKPKVKDYLSVITTNIQRFIGRHKMLWFIIKYSNLKK